MKKKIIYILTAFAVLFTFLFSSCATNQEEVEPQPEPPVVEEQVPVEPVEEPEEIGTGEDEVILIQDENDGSDDEYLRSIANLDEAEAVSKQEFTDDKNEILEIISELALVINVLPRDPTEQNAADAADNGLHKS